MRVSSLLLAALLLAGCSSAPSDKEGGARGGNQGDGAGGNLPAPAFAPPVALSGVGGPEPVIAVAADGTLYVAAQDAGAGVPHFWVSTDGGATWTASSPSAQSGGEVDLAAGPGGFVYLTQLGPQGNVISVSRNHGQTWTPSPLAALTQSFDRELIAVDSAGSAYVVSRQFGSATAAVVSRSDNGGVTFLRQGNAWDVAHLPGTSNGNLLSTSSGIVMPYVCHDSNAVCLAKSGDRGATWTQRVVAARGVHVDNVYPVVASEGTALVVVWSDNAGGRIAVWGARSSDGGGTWSAPTRLSASDESASLPWVASAAGNTWVTYVATSDDLPATDSAGASSSSWRVVAARLDAARMTVLERGPALAEPVHVGPISKPLSRLGDSGAPDRTFGDFYTITVNKAGKALIAVPQTAQGATQDLVIAQR